MKFFEMANEFKTRPIVYVDMDGVLADFFGEVAREHDVAYWREIHRKDLGIDQVAKAPGFFEELPPMPHAALLIAGVLTLAGDYSILSSPLMSNVEQSSDEKAEWLRRHLSDHQPQAIIFDHEKYKFAKQADGTPNILIDDWDTNIRLWEHYGGIGILYKDSECDKALKKLTKALHGKVVTEKSAMALDEGGALDVDVVERLFTNQQVLRYVQGIHDEYHMPKPILKHKTWILKTVPVRQLKTPEFVHQDDPYRRVIDLNWDHIANIDIMAIRTKPIVADADGWVLDGNHRCTAARAAGLQQIPAIVPYLEN
jgi:5'(3')-deoxyribonucleotidase